jgi:hypothetical protein
MKKLNSFLALSRKLYKKRNQESSIEEEKTKAKWNKTQASEYFVVEFCEYSIYY